VAGVYNESDTLIDSGTMSSSGDGHYFRNFTIPNSAGFYVAETISTISGLPYKNRKRFQAVKGEV